MNNSVVGILKARIVRRHPIRYGFIPPYGDARATAAMILQRDHTGQQAGKQELCNCYG